MNTDAIRNHVNLDRAPNPSPKGANHFYTRSVLILAAMIIIVFFPVRADADFSGAVGMSLTHYFHPPLSGDQHDTPFWSFYAEPRYYHEWEGGDRAVSISPFFRADFDPSRTRLDFRELYFQGIGDQVEVLVGMNKVFWGVTESRHLVDVINQTDVAEDFYEEEKLGQPMINLTFEGGGGTVDFFILPWFRERVFPDERGRLRPFYPIDTDNPRYESSRKNRHVDVAARWFLTLFDADLGLSFFSGTCREPRLISAPDSPGQLIPYYYLCRQASIDFQWIADAWLWKVEALYRTGDALEYGAAVMGFEYTVERIFNTPASFAVLWEYQWEDSPAETATAGDNDIFLGTRILFNDFQSTEILAGATLDHRNGSVRFKIEGSRRIGQAWTIDLTGGFFSHIPDTDPLWSFRKDDFVQIQLNRYF